MPCGMHYVSHQYTFIMATRKKLSDSAQFEIVYHSARRCCMCYALGADFSQKAGQIAHLDQDRTKDAVDNLVWLCLPHHDAYDSKTSQSKGYIEAEVRQYRDQLYSEVARWRTTQPHEESDNLFQFKQNLIEKNLGLFFFAALASQQPALRSVLIADLTDSDFKSQLADAWAFLDRRVDDEESKATRQDAMASYIGRTEQGKKDLSTLLGLASSAISAMSEQHRNEALFAVHDDTIRSALLLLHKIRGDRIREQSGG